MDFNKLVVVITSILGAKEIANQLEIIGVKHIFLGWQIDRSLNMIVQHPPIADQDLIYIQRLKSMMNDDSSREIIDKIVSKRNNGDFLWDDIATSKMYFPTDIISLRETESFADGGAYDGDTIQAFLQETRGRFKAVYAFEPDLCNYEKLCKNCLGIENISFFNIGLYDKEQLLQFDSRKGGSSSIVKNGLGTIKVNCLDNIITDEVTFIKMDVEGAEREALEGARQLISKYMPKLAISIYHKEDDLWRIPFYIKDNYPEYKLYIRHHSPVFAETVLYATV